MTSEEELKVVIVADTSLGKDVGCVALAHLLEDSSIQVLDMWDYTDEHSPEVVMEMLKERNEDFFFHTSKTEQILFSALQHEDHFKLIKDDVPLNNFGWYRNFEKTRKRKGKY